MAKKKTTKSSRKAGSRSAKKKKQEGVHIAWFGLLAAIGEVGYISLVASIMWIGDKFVPLVNTPIYGFVLMLTLFVFSAVISGLIVLGYPIFVAMKGDVKKALALIGWTSFFLFAAFIIGLGLGTYIVG